MKTGRLLQSFLLTTGLILGGISTVEAHNEYSGHPHAGKHHHFPNHTHGTGHAPWRFSGHHGKHHAEHFRKHGKSNGHYHSHWQYDRRDGYGDGRDHGTRWKYGKYDGREDARRKGQRSRSAGIGYTGRS